MVRFADEVYLIKKRSENLSDFITLEIFVYKIFFLIISIIESLVDIARNVNPRGILTIMSY